MNPRFNPADVILPEGARLGSYVVRAPIARGGMAAVYRAEHSWSGHEVALKCVRLPKEAEAGSRFRREAIALAQTSGEHLVHYFDGNEADGGVMWIAMELMASNLRDEIYSCWKASSTGLRISRALEVVEGVAKGLETLHSKRILHRDIKPENIGFAQDGAVKILDFGLVKFLDGVFQTTDVSLVPGTPAYMAPEQLTGERLGPATDIYALGITLYEMVAGIHPFAIDDANCLPGNVALQQQTREIPDIAGLPKPLARLIQRMTEKSPGARISSATALLGELGKARRTLSVQRALGRSFTGTPDPYDGTKPGVNESKLILLRSFAIGGALSAAGVLAILTLPRALPTSSAEAASASHEQQLSPSKTPSSAPDHKQASPVEPREPPPQHAATPHVDTPIAMEEQPGPKKEASRTAPQRPPPSNPRNETVEKSKPSKVPASDDDYPWPEFKDKSAGKEDTKASTSEPVFLFE